MAMGTRKGRERQSEMWIATSAIVETPGNAFFDRLNKILSEHKFDARVEALCRKFYKKSPYGRPSLAPGVYFRALLIGYFEGVDSERGIAWRAADSLSLRGFLGYALDEATPDHSTISRTRRLYWVETHKAIFRWVVRILTGEGLISGQTVSIDATTLEANAAMKNIVRREDGQTYHDYLKGLALAVGIENPTREQLARLDRKRKKKGSNEQWMSPADPDARITKRKDGRTHLAHKAEHAVDLSSGAVLAITLQPASDGDTDTIHRTLAEAQSAAREFHERAVEEVIADKGYHSGGWRSATTPASINRPGTRRFIRLCSIASSARPMSLRANATAFMCSATTPYSTNGGNSAPTPPFDRSPTRMRAALTGPSRSTI